MGLKRFVDKEQCQDGVPDKVALAKPQVEQTLSHGDCQRGAAQHDQQAQPAVALHEPMHLPQLACLPEMADENARSETKADGKDGDVMHEYVSRPECWNPLRTGRRGDEKLIGVKHEHGADRRQPGANRQAGHAAQDLPVPLAAQGEQFRPAAAREPAGHAALQKRAYCRDDGQWDQSPAAQHGDDLRAERGRVNEAGDERVPADVADALQEARPDGGPNVERLAGAENRPGRPHNRMAEVVELEVAQVKKTECPRNQEHASRHDAVNAPSALDEVGDFALRFGGEGGVRMAAALAFGQCDAAGEGDAEAKVEDAHGGPALA